MTNKITRAATMLWDANPPIRDASSPTVLAENNAIFLGRIVLRIEHTAIYSIQGLFRPNSDVKFIANAFDCSNTIYTQFLPYFSDVYINRPVSNNYLTAPDLV